MSRLLPSLLACAALCAGAMPTQAAAPQPFRAEYAVYVDGKPAGESTMELVATAAGAASSTTSPVPRRSSRCRQGVSPRSRCAASAPRSSA